MICREYVFFWGVLEADPRMISDSWKNWRFNTWIGWFNSYMYIQHPYHPWLRYTITFINHIITLKSISSLLFWSVSGLPDLHEVQRLATNVARRDDLFHHVVVKMYHTKMVLPHHQQDKVVGWCGKLVIMIIKPSQMIKHIGYGPTIAWNDEGLSEK